MENIELILSENVKRIRKEKKLSQEALAENCGLSTFAIQSIESARQWPELGTIQKIAKGLGVGTIKLFQMPHDSQDNSLDLIRNILSLDSEGLAQLNSQITAIKKGMEKRKQPKSKEA